MRQIIDQQGWKGHLDVAILSLRLGMEGMAGERMTWFIDSLAPRLSRISPERMQQLTPLLGDALAAQTRKDYLRMADLLQYEIKPLLEHC